MTDEMKKKLGIKSTKDAHEHGLKILIHGPSGVGKTTLAGTLPGKTLLLNVENGTLVLKDKDIDVLDVKKISSDNPDEMTLLKAYTMIKSGELEYDNIVLDSLTEISETLFQTLDSTMDAKAKDFGGLFVRFKSEILKLTKAFRDLPGVNVVFITLSDLIDVNSMQKFVPSLPHKKTQMSIMALFDEALFIESDVTGKRSIRTTETSQHMAKTRTGIEDGTTTMDLAKLYPSLEKGK